MMDYYWHIELYSKEIIKIKPDAQNIAQIQKMIAAQSGAITTPTRSIIIKDIKDFRQSDEPYTDQKLLEDVARAFNEPIFTEEGVKAQWVKKTVPRRIYEKHYRYSAYKILEEGESLITVAFVLPSHQVDRQKVSDLSAIEESRLTHS